MGVQLKVQKRERLTRSETSSIRNGGGFPAIFYGKGINNQAVSVSSNDFIKVIREVGQNGVFNLDLGDGVSHSVMVHDLQKDSLKGEIVHVDFYQVDMKVELDAEVAIHIVGEPAGARDGGVTQHTGREVTVRALPSDIPSHIDINIEHLDIGDSILVSDLQKNPKYAILDDENEVIVSILPPSQENVDEETEDGEETTGEEVPEAE